MEEFDRAANGRKTASSYRTLSAFQTWMLYNEEYHRQVCLTTNLNLVNNQKPGMSFNEYLRFVAIRKIMQAIKLPDRKLYWATKFQTGVEGLNLPNVSSIMPRDRWYQIRQYLRFENYENPLIGKTDKIWKKLEK